MQEDFNTQDVPKGLKKFMATIWYFITSLIKIIPLLGILYLVTITTCRKCSNEHPKITVIEEQDDYIEPPPKIRCFIKLGNKRFNSPFSGTITPKEGIKVNLTILGKTPDCVLFREAIKNHDPNLLMDIENLNGEKLEKNVPVFKQNSRALARLF